jgi:hypothetical protein
MLAAHIDDSGSQGEGPVFILAGYVADTEQWKKFSDQWQIALDLKPKLKIVKVQHAFRLEEGWGRFNAAQRDARLKRFSSIIHRHVKMGIVVSCGWDDLTKLKKEFFPKGGFQAYSILFNGLMSDLVRHLHMRGVREKIDFVFDEQGALGRMAVQIFENIWHDLPPELAQMVGGRPIHRDDEEVLPLQAAHTIAWVHRRDAHEHNRIDFPNGWKPTQRCLKKLGEIPTLYSWYPYERLERNFSLAQAELDKEARSKPAGA